LKGYADLITASPVFKRLKFLAKFHKSSLVIDGGNLVSDGTVAVLTDKVFRENPDRRRSEIERELKTTLAVKRLVFIPQEPADPIGHSDGMVRFIRKGQVILNNYAEFDRNFDAELAAALTKQDLAIERFPYVPSDGSDTGIPPAIGNYVNYLRVGSLIVMPKYGLPQDQTASMRIASLIPDAEVISVASRELAQEGGVLNCATWTVRTNATD
jgi:agmatine deiminase